MCWDPFYIDFIRLALQLKVKLKERKIWKCHNFNVFPVNVFRDIGTDYKLL